MFQLKKQDKTSEKELKQNIVKQSTWKRVQSNRHKYTNWTEEKNEWTQWELNKKIKNIKKNQMEPKNIIT